MSAQEPKGVQQRYAQAMGADLVRSQHHAQLYSRAWIDRMSKLLVALVVASASALAITPSLGQTPPPSSHSYSAHVASGCTLQLKYTATEEAEQQLEPSDKEALGFLAYQVYASTHNVYSDLVAAGEANREESVQVPTYTERQAHTRQSGKPRSNPAQNPRAAVLPQDALDAANHYTTAFQFFAPTLQLQIIGGELECSRTAIDRTENVALDRKEHIERALAFVADPDPALQERGLRVLDSEANPAYLWSLPEAQQRQITSVAFRLCRDELLALQAVHGRGGAEFIGVDMLEKLHDPRTVDAYMAYVTSTLPFGASDIALKRLAKMVPRPTQILAPLAALIEKYPEEPTRFYDDAFATLFVVGHEEARPIFEKFTRSHNEYVARKAQGAIDALNDARRHPHS